jgi:hypothetical protein
MWKEPQLESSRRSTMPNRGVFACSRPGTEGSNPAPSSGESITNSAGSLTRIGPTDVLPSRIPLFRPWRIDGTGARDRAGRAATGWPRRGAALRRRRGPNSPFPKMLDAAILASQTEGIRGMAAKAADLRR